MNSVELTCGWYLLASSKQSLRSAVGVYLEFLKLSGIEYDKQYVWSERVNFLCVNSVRSPVSVVKLLGKHSPQRHREAFSDRLLRRRSLLLDAHALN